MTIARDNAAEHHFVQFRKTRNSEYLARSYSLVAPDLMRIAARLARVDEAADLVQQTFVAAIESMDQFHANGQLLPWLIGILKNIHRTNCRASRSHGVPSNQGETLEAGRSIGGESVKTASDFD